MGNRNNTPQRQGRKERRAERRKAGQAIGMTAYVALSDHHRIAAEIYDTYAPALTLNVRSMLS